MSKILLFFGLTWLFGNPFIAIIVLLLVIYALERRFVGLSPSLVKPLRRRSSIGKLRKQQEMSPHDLSVKSELARLLIESGKHVRARDILQGIEQRMEHSAEYWSDLGTCELALGRLEEGERAMKRALSISPKVKYGQPYLKLAEALAKTDPGRAIQYLQQFKEVNSSSCEAYYRLGTIYADLGKSAEAAEAFGECRQLYRALPKYMKRHERKWALRAFMRNRA
ncbi:tetratricopeptide repeat protein [Cohnella phaseoli]|uniref:Tetratricopeptide repeat protein n=1 Tax=Cohnella phaseoli TaxID=456490 RepID=A0A3D9JRS0_9BACL|nr:tetratricopeptide repeat protein [Cohnella phaseoli]RED76640.1 tetratricopeptide repeat protein [Cohnella phaseoli]